MSLNIKNPRVHALARAAAQVTGKSQTSVVEEALVLLLEKYDADPVAAEHERKLARLREIGRAFDEDPGDPDREIKTIADLYDEETGLPR